MKRLIKFLKSHLLNGYGIVPFKDYNKRHYSRQIVLFITLTPICVLLTILLSLLLVELKTIF